MPGWNDIWSAKQMKMIRHDDIASDQPVARHRPCIDKVGVKFGIRQAWPAVLGAYGEKNDDRTVALINRQVMRGAASVRGNGIVVLCGHRCGRSGDRPSMVTDLNMWRAGLLTSLFNPHNKSICASSAGATEIFFFGRASGAAGRVTVTSSDSSWARMVLARSMTSSGRPARRATWMP